MRWASDNPRAIRSATHRIDEQYPKNADVLVRAEFPVLHALFQLPISEPHAARTPLMNATRTREAFSHDARCDRDIASGLHRGMNLRVNCDHKALVAGVDAWQGVNREPYWTADPGRQR